ncbi:hypothetical protein BN1013_01288 [Candidatus Rubidus massiliensis]|nr:hypothetical protein BN1013_01288 [Candidatus Rubidus massiliensis]
METSIDIYPNLKWYLTLLSKNELEIDPSSFIYIPTDQTLASIQKVQLIYLATINLINNKSPLTFVLKNACKRSSFAKKRVIYSIFFGILFTIVILAPINYLGLQNNLIATSTALTIQACIMSLISYYATGIAPYIASNKDNITQNALHTTAKIYENLSYALLELFYSDDRNKSLAIEISYLIDFNIIEKKIIAEVGEQELLLNALTSLKEAVAYIKNHESLDTIKINIPLKGYIYFLKIKNYSEL